MRFVYVVSRADALECLPQEIRFKRITFKIDTKVIVLLINKSKAFFVDTMADDSLRVIRFSQVVEWIVLISAGKSQAEVDKLTPRHPTAFQPPPEEHPGGNYTSYQSIIQYGD